MVTVSSAFISSRRERIRFSVLSASGCAFKAAAWVDVLRAVFGALGKTDLDNTDVARDHFLSLYRGCRILRQSTDHTMHVGLMVSIFQFAPDSLSGSLSSSLPASVRVPQPGRGQVHFKAGEEHPGRRAAMGKHPCLI